MLEKILLDQKLLTLQAKRLKIIIAALVVFGLIVFLLAMYSMGGQAGIGFINKPTIEWMADHRNPVLSKSMEIYATVLRPEAIILGGMLASIIWLSRKREVWRPLLLFGGLGLTATLALSIKWLTKNPRPDISFQLPPFEPSYSFPSAHVASLLAVCLIVIYLIHSRAAIVNYTRLSIALGITVLLTVLMIIDRLYLAAHWPTDIIGSFGFICLVLAIVIGIDYTHSRLAKRYLAKVSPSGNDQ